MKSRFSVLTILLFASLLSNAQGIGSIVGTVTDPTGSVIPGAKITATEVGTGLARSVISNNEGYYVIASLKPAQYDVSVVAPGFRQYQGKGVTLLADQSLTMNVNLQLGAATEVVEVTGQESQVDTTTSTMKQVIETARVNELPMNGRNAAQLTLLVPGVVNSPNGGADQGTTKTFPGAVTYATNGTRQNTLSYSLDGGNYVDEYTNVNQPFPFPDALQEFSVQTSNYSAQYGQNAGAVVNVVTKSGTNNFHGNAFEFVRNPIFNAQNFFATPTTPDRVKRNQFGGTFGGPIRRDRTFFFGGYQRTFFRDLSLNSSRVVGQTDITNFLAKGPFGTPGVIDPAVATLLGINPTTGADLGGSAKFHLAGPIPAGSNPTVPFTRPVTQNFDSAMAKVDHSIGESDKITGRYEYDRFTQAGVFNPLQLVSYRDATFSITNQNYLAHETHTFSPRLLNDFRFSISHEVATRGPANAVDVSAFGVALPFQPKPSAIQGIGVQGGFSWGDNPRGIFNRFNFAFGNDVTWERGKHNLHFGGDIERSHVDLDNEFNQPGIFGFGTSDNYLFGGTSFSTYQLFLAGILSDGSGAGNGYAFQQGAGEFKNNRNTFSGVYAQDNFRVSRRLTLNLGLRWEPALPWSDTGNRWAQVNLTKMAANVTSRVYPNAPPGILFSSANGIPSDPGMPRNALNANLKGFAPRVGFAWDIFGDGKTSLRGGSGIFYDSRVMGMLSNRFVDEWPFSPQFILSTAGTSAPTASSTAGSFSDPLCTLAATQAALKCNGVQKSIYPTFPSPFPAPTNFAYNPPFNQIAVSYDPSGEYKVPTVYAWNLAIERQLPWQMLARSAYVGTRSIHLLETQFLNYAVPTGIAGCPNSFSLPGKAGVGIANCTVFLGSGGKFGTNTFSPTVQADINDINSVYHSLQLSLEKRVSHGLTVLANYTYSKSLDDLPFGEGVSGFDTGYSALPLSNANRHRFDYGPSGFDRTHVFVGSFVWQSPSLKNSNSIVHTLLGGYEVGGIVSASSGRPITVLQGTEISGTGIGKDRGTLVPGVSPYGQNSCAGVTASCVSWLNAAAFAPTKVGGVNNPAIFGTFGNIGKNALRLPRTSNVDMQLSKYFSLTERFKLQLRAEYFNVFNHPNFLPDGPAQGTDEVGSFDRLNNNASFGTFRAGQAADPRIGQMAVKFIF